MKPKRMSRDVTTTDGAETAAPPDGEAMLLTNVQLARMLQISVRSLYRLRSEKRLPPPLRVGGFTRWRRTDIETWVADGCPLQRSTIDEERRG